MNKKSIKSQIKKVSLELAFKNISSLSRPEALWQAVPQTWAIVMKRCGFLFLYLEQLDGGSWKTSGSMRVDSVKAGHIDKKGYVPLSFKVVVDLRSSFWVDQKAQRGSSLCHINMDEHLHV